VQQNMNIDLLINDDEEAGLVSDTPFEAAVSGVIFDHNENIISLEFANMESKTLNVPVDLEFQELLQDLDRLYIGVLEDRIVTETYIVPIAHVKA
tara:strand:+ start:208 stop:492 length:285 start_codon:yes stop_codon:yes gene_type:complete